MVGFIRRKGRFYKVQEKPRVRPLQLRGRAWGFGECTWGALGRWVRFRV